MLQRKEIGAYRSKASVMQAKIGKTYVTPNNLQYTLKTAEKVGKKWIYTYQLLSLDNSPCFQSPVELGALEIMEIYKTF
jgi:hypothetical protein